MSLGLFIPTYNCGQYIAETIDSVLSQSMPLIKIVVVDNCSTDNTEEIVLKYVHQGVQYIRHPVNIGVVANHNYCLDLADTDYIKLLSADDVLLPGILALQLKALKNNPSCGIATCGYFVTDSHLTAKSNVMNIPGLTKGGEAIKICATKVANLIGNPSSTLLRRKAIGTIRFNANFKWHGDLRFFCDVLLKSDLVNVDIPGVLYRRHDQTDSMIACTTFIRLDEELRFVSEFSSRKVEPHLRLLKRYGFKYVAKYINTFRGDVG